MADIRYYDVILKPVITEKSMSGMGDKEYTFLVHPDATKTQVKEAVEKRRIHPVRYQNYTEMYEELKNRRRY